MFSLFVYWASLIAQLIKNLPAMQDTPVQFLDQDSSILGLLVAQLVKNPPAMRETWVRYLAILAWRIPWTVETRRESDMTQ